MKFIMSYSSRYLLLIILIFNLIYYVKTSLSNECNAKADSENCTADFLGFATENCSSRKQKIVPNLLFIPRSNEHTIELLLDCHNATSSCYFAFLMLDVSNVGNCFKVSQTNLNYQQIGCFEMKCGDSVQVPDLNPGNYCTLLYHRSSENKSFGPRYCLDFGVSSNSEKLESNESDHSVVITEMTQNYIIILFVVLFAILAVVIAIATIVTCKLRKLLKKPCVSPESGILSFDSSTKMNISDVIQSTKPTRVFILYSRDCEHHQDFVNKLATFFSQASCLVSYNVWEVQKIATNKVGWISEKLNGDYKILLICSKKGYEKQQAWLQNKSSIHSETSDDQLFLQAIATIMHRSEQAFDYTKLFILRPSYVSQEFVPSDICPGRQYVLPQNLSTLLCHLHDVDTRMVDVEDNSVKQWSQCSDAYEKLVDSIHKLSIGNVECDCCGSKCKA